MDIKLAQINIARCALGMDDLKSFLERSDIQVLMVQEPYVRSYISWPGCRIFWGADAGEDVWTMTVVRDPSLSAVLSVGLSSAGCTVLEVTRSNGALDAVLVNCYFRYSESIDPHIQNLEDVILAYPGRSVVIGADVNARSTLWFNDSTDERGDKLESLIIAYDLAIANCRSELTTFENTRGHRSNIDVTLYTNYGHIREVHWNICAETFLTDHRMLTSRVVFRDGLGDTPWALLPSEGPHKRNVRDIDWSRFDASLIVDLGEAVDFAAKTVDDKIDILTTMLLRAEREAVPLKKKSRKVTPRWWCE